MPVERLGVQELVGDPKVVAMNSPMTPPPSLPETTKPTTLKDDRKDALYMAIQATFTVAARILAIRLFLFLSLIGSFALSVIATDNGTAQSSWVLVLYAMVTTLPLTVLELMGKRNGG